MQDPVALAVGILIDPADHKVKGIVCSMPLGCIDMPFLVFGFIPGKYPERVIFHDHFQFPVKIFFPVKRFIELFYDHKNSFPSGLHNNVSFRKNITRLKSKRNILFFYFLIYFHKNMILFIRYLPIMNFEKRKLNLILIYGNISKQQKKEIIK